MSTSFEPDKIVQAKSDANVSLPAENKSIENVPEQGNEAKRVFAGGMLAPFKVRNFNLLFGGQTISTIGDALYAVALPWLILNNGGSARELGIVLTAYGIPRVGSVLLGGWLSDRLRPRRLMLVADAFRALLVGLLAALALWGHPTLWQLCAIALPLGAFGGAFLPASAAILPDLLPDESLQAGNALNFSFTQAANLVGSALAGVVVAALTAGTGLALDALSFVVSAASLALVSGKSQQQRQDVEGTPPVEDASGQITFGRFMRGSRLMQVILLVGILANFCLGGLMEVALPTLAHGSMHAGASGYGLVLAAFGAGALAGGVFAGMLGKLKRKGLVALLVALVMALSLALTPYWGVPGAMAWMLIGGISNSVTNVLLITMLQLTIPRHLMGRAMGLLMFTSFGAYPISVALAGVLTSQLGPTILFPFSGLMLGLAVLLGLAQRELREL